ncbi:hypothetical protein V6N12_038496 [Hibiscus sabdariffa]|uniref:Uncharacterized protein n=1 Tax=Hibiscus sabdariffa TaxID=183260 RepID=A0ABR2BJL5_9ROSI
MPNYAKFLKDMVSRKSRIGEFETAAATETYLAMMHNKVPANKTNPGSFIIPYLIGHNYSTKALCDPSASINIMPKSVFQKLDYEADEHAPIILGRPFLATGRVMINFEKGELALRVDGEQVKIKVFTVQGQHENEEECKALHALAEKCTQKLKPYKAPHTERDKTTMFLRDA